MGASKASSSPYESARNQRVEENKRRLQELGLTDLSRDLSNNAVTTRPSPGPKRGRPCAVTKEKVTLQLRRSTRNSGGEQPDYVEVEIDIRRRARFDNTGATRHYSRLYERKYASEEARMSATEKAEALKKMLPQTHASFVKPMLQSHVTGGFWLGLPVAFCRDYLPKKDERIVLEDDKNEEWETIYLSNKTGLSGGWRGFSLDHGLVDGDALVFELVEPKRFKVHIIRVYSDNGAEADPEGDGAEQGTEAIEEKV
ncbi:hypothetical protein GOP47_0003048 [Adiantum capillus-veneris]|uniref:TF-B3 domain-containing protein n=1 Tax=Adiantum capillus-veneris TaxID=13818 RepID=A0A9D4ZS57_ADICA|nr:hypothetical protein GOP47_0003048 [Adiantum capillus-veneris]